MLFYFCEFIDNAGQIDEQLKLYYSEYLEKLGITEEVLMREMNKIQQEELKRERE